LIVRTSFYLKLPAKFLMMKKGIDKLLISSVLLGVSVGGLQAQTKIELEAVEVSTARSRVNFEQTARSVTIISAEEIAASPAKNLNELLEYVGNVDIRQRGQNGIQADVSLRGSSFEQVLILLNGVKMTDPQTGHHNLNLPIALLDIERIEILHGGAARVYGPGAFAGAINIITKNPEDNQVKVQLLGGQNGLQQYGVSAGIVGKNQSHTISWQQQKSDGFIRNTDHEMQTIFWQSEIKTEKSRWLLNLGQNEKAFGAQNFYTSRFPDQFEETRSQFASLAGDVELSEKLKLTAKGYYRKHNDRFELFREAPGYFRRLAQGGFANDLGDTISWYNGHNYHQTNVYGTEINFSFKSKLGQSSIGYDYRREEILSNVLGSNKERIAVVNEHPSAFYLRSEERENQSVFIEHNYTNDKLFISVGALLNMNSAFDDEIYPGADIAYQLTEEIRPYASFNRSFRFPTYTDLYFNLGGIVGSKELKPEESDNYELGVKYRDAATYGHLAVFRREGNNLIDWIRYTGSSTTQAANLTHIVIDGIEVDYVISKNSFLKDYAFFNQLRFNYAYLTSEDNSSGFESNYVLDFLQHKADAIVQFKLSELVFLDWNLSYQNRKGEYVDVNGAEQEYDAVFISDVKLSTKQNNLNLFLQLSNVFDQKYIDIGNVENPGRWISLGVNYQFNPMSKK